jgi:hypothetical protein
VLDEHLLRAFHDRGDHRPSQGPTTPIVPVRPVGRPAALGDGTYPSSAAAPRTTSLVAGATPGNPRSARETVATDTPARGATSVMLLHDPGPEPSPA